MNGMKVQASITMIVSLAISGEPKNEGCSQPSHFASRASGPNRTSSMDLPTIQLSATGDSISGRRKVTRQNFRARISAFSNSARPNAMAYSTMIAST